MKKILLTLMLMIVMVLPVKAEDKPLPETAKMVKNYDLFKRIPVLDDGRIKPLDTYARNLLVRFSGKDSYTHTVEENGKKVREHYSAIQWFAKLLFAFDQIKDDKVFLINNPDIATALGVEVDAHRRYTFGQLQKSAKKLNELAQAAKHIEQKQRSLVEEEIIRVYDNLELCAGLSQVMLFTFPHPDLLNNSYLDVAMNAKQLHEATTTLGMRNEATWDENDRNSMKLLKTFFHWSMTFTKLPLQLIPSSQQAELWLNPWDAITQDFKNPTTKELLTDWQTMTAAYWQGEQIQFDMAAKHYLETIAPRFSKLEKKHANTFSLELAYHAWSPFLWAKLFYILAFIIFIISLLSSSKIWYKAAWLAIILGFIPHLWAMVVRVIIMDRPPVSTLYETFIFVAIISVLLGMWVERINKQWLGILVASISGAAFLFIASRYSAEGDTLKMLVAVLNSNFWLATHVTTITMGYAATCVAGVLGHLWLFQACFKKTRPKLDNTYQVMMLMLGVSLTLTFLGTNLGGIWADQSWGRFWGWDPKENGALMIVLWSIMLFHAKIAKMIGPFGMAIGNAMGVIVVMWAWFGVNLLSIGLHSYGFTSGIALSLSIYLACEIIFIGVTAYFAKKNGIR